MKTLTKPEREKAIIRTMAFAAAMTMILGGIIFDDSIGVLHHIFILIGGMITGAILTKHENV